MLEFAGLAAVAGCVLSVIAFCWLYEIKKATRHCADDLDWIGRQLHQWAEDRRAEQEARGPAPPPAAAAPPQADPGEVHVQADWARQRHLR